ncbi:MAG: prenyltransferase [Gemmatimonadales bacterium]|nr:prenyltransferase [Gemmatimonadales bacterium]
MTKANGPEAPATHSSGSPSMAAAVFGSIRAPFLTLPPVCVLLGWACSNWIGHPVNIVHLLLILLGSLAAHMSVNSLNEYHDFRSGLDFQTQRTPFSGGSGSLPAQPHAGPLVLATGLITLAITAAIGIFFITLYGPAILPLGIAGLIIIGTYTTVMTRSAFLCLIAPGLGFGSFMVIGTYLALGGQWHATPVIASLIPFFLVSNLLLINQFPDYEADRQVGRRHLIIVHGVQAGIRVYGVFLILTYLSVIVGVALGFLPVWSLLGLLTVPLAIRVFGGLKKHAEDIPQLIPFLGQNVLLVLATPVLVAAGMFIG